MNLLYLGFLFYQQCLDVLRDLLIQAVVLVDRVAFLHFLAWVVSYPFLDFVDQDFLLLFKLYYTAIEALFHLFNLLFGARGGLLRCKRLLWLQDYLRLLSTLRRAVSWRNVSLIAWRRTTLQLLVILHDLHVLDNGQALLDGLRRCRCHHHVILFQFLYE